MSHLQAYFSKETGISDITEARDALGLDADWTALEPYRGYVVEGDRRSIMLLIGEMAARGCITLMRVEFKAEPAAAPAADTKPIRVIVAFGPYNERRYSKPWIARIAAWPVGEKPVVDFGRFLGRPGSEGEVEIMAQRGDVIRWGQKDHRVSWHNTPSHWGLVKEDGSIEETTESAARKHWLETHDND